MKTLITLAGLACLSGGLSAQTPSTQDISLLNDRLHMQAPAGAVIQARTGSLMGATSAADNETRVVYEKNGDKMVVMCYEMKATAEQGFPAAAQKRIIGYLEDDAPDYTIGTKGGDIVYAVRNKPVVHKARDEANLYGIANYRQKDDTLQHIAFYFNNKSIENHEACAAAVNNGIQSLKAGKRALELDARTVPLPPASAKQEITISLPKNHSLSVDRGADFFVTRIKEVAPIGQAHNQMGIYMGHHSQFDPAQHNDAKKIPATVFGQPVIWYQNTLQDNDGKDYTNTETLVQPSVVPGDDSPYFHLFIVTPDAASAQTLINTASTLTIHDSSTKKNARAAEAEPTHTVSMLHGTLSFDIPDQSLDLKRKTIHHINDHSIGIDIHAKILIGILAQKTNVLAEDGFPQTAIPRLLKELKQYKNFREEDFLFSTLHQNIVYAIRQQAPVHTHQYIGYNNPDPQPPYAIAEYRQTDGTLLKIRYTFTSTPSPQEHQKAISIIRGSITSLRSGNDNTAPLPQ